jgi:hypothetical protein
MPLISSDRVCKVEPSFTSKLIIAASVILPMQTVHRVSIVNLLEPGLINICELAFVE